MKRYTFDNCNVVFYPGIVNVCDVYTKDNEFVLSVNTHQTGARAARVAKAYAERNRAI